MPDIAKCSGEGCTKRESCYRYMAPASMFQYWIASPAVGAEPEFECEFYIEDKP